MITKKNLALTTLAFAAGVSTASAQTLLWSDNFDSPLVGWTPAGGQINEVNQQFVVSGSFGPLQTNSPNATHAAGIHSIPTAGPLPDHQTLELRADLVSANQNDAWAGLHFLFGWPSQAQGYVFFKDEDEVALVKFWNGATSFAWFFYENRPLKSQNVTLVFGLTRSGSVVKITTRVLDKDNANAVLFERTVTDTPLADPVLPNGAARGVIGMADPPGTPWPVVQAATDVELTLTWASSQAAPQPPAQVTYDNLEVWQYESPQLAIQNAVVLSWPVTQGDFVLESAASVNGPWEAIAEPWSRIEDGKTEVSVLAPDSLKLFRLRQAP